MPGHLMPEDHRFAQADRAEPAMIVIMQIAAADATKGEIDLGFARARGSGRARFQPEIPGSVNDDCLHDGPLCGAVRVCRVIITSKSCRIRGLSPGQRHNR